MEIRPLSSSAPARAIALSCRRARRVAAWLGLAVFLLGLLNFGAGAFAAPQPVVVVPVAGAISPASADFVTRGLARAARDQAQLLVLELDTPGGLDTSMRQIIKAILASPVPVAAYIGPSGARAASAGTYIVYASHIAAMAPGTNLGAATPIEIGVGRGPASPMPLATPPAASAANEASGARTNDKSKPQATQQEPQSTEERKRIGDAAAYIRGLAQLRGRNAEWAERAVRQAVSLSANEAVEQRVVDLSARDVPDLLRKLDGRSVETASGEHRLATAQAPIIRLTPDWRSRLLAVITDPNVALILLTIGIYGLFFEFANPGFVLPGVAGAISLLIALFALQLLPISYTGLALVFLGMAFLIAEAFLPTFGALGIGGIVAFAAGALMLIDTDVPGYGIPLPVIAALSLVSLLFVLFVSRFALKARHQPVVTGSEAIVGCLGEIADEGLAPVDAKTDSEASGWAVVLGERWQVRAPQPLAAGTRVRVTSRSGLTLTVVPAFAKPQQGETS